MKNAKYAVLFIVCGIALILMTLILLPWLILVIIALIVVCIVVFLSPKAPSATGLSASTQLSESGTLSGEDAGGAVRGVIDNAVEIGALGDSVYDLAFTTEKLIAIKIADSREDIMNMVRGQFVFGMLGSTVVAANATTTEDLAARLVDKILQTDPKDLENVSKGTFSMSYSDIERVELQAPRHFISTAQMRITTDSDVYAFSLENSGLKTDDGSLFAKYTDIIKSSIPNKLVMQT